MRETLLTSKAIPVSNSELERIQREFKFFSPVQKPYKTAPLPKQGEDWRLDRSLPSGLLLQVRDEYHKRWGKMYPKRSDVFRRLQYGDLEQHKRENPWLAVQIRNTSSISWHPTERLLVTAGDGIIAKLWDTETGKLITQEPLYSTSPGDSISWSYDGEVFAVDKCLFDGGTGEELAFIPGPGSGRYTGYRYSDLRGMRDYYAGASHLSFSYNFSPWRPGTNQYMLLDIEASATGEGAVNPWKPDSNQYGKCLVFRNRCTGEIEKAIDSSVSSQIEDFAWHPSGRFIAVAFRDYNARIIDIDDARTIDSLSVQHLVGWSPDGKGLVLRKEKGKADFVIWDALETKEKPMPEEIRNELWFKRFFANISADGLRYIKNVNIYSVNSDELIATLPKQVSSAAWSPIDGGLLATCDGSETHIWSL